MIFAFGGNALICTSFYVVQRTCAARLWGGNLAWFVFWGYQLFIVLAASGYPKAQVRNFDGQPEITELDALIAYLQMLGTLVDFSTYDAEANAR